jgi:DNA-binding MarR family transcriptional regulator
MNMSNFLPGYGIRFLKRYQVTPLKITKIYLVILIILDLLLVSTLILSISTTGEFHGSPRIGKPDLTIITMDVYNTAGMAKPANFDQDFQYETSTIEFSDDEPIEGQTVIINTTVFNIGSEGTDAVVYFYDGPKENDDLIGTDTITIEPLSYDEAQTFWNTTHELEYHSIFVLVIPEDPQNETDETNNEANKDITVNQIPIAFFKGPDTGEEDEIVEFDGSFSTDTQSDLDSGLRFIWNFGDPFDNITNPSEVSGINLTRPTHVFTKKGSYEIMLRVQDDGGAFHIFTKSIKIENIAPIAEFQVSTANPFEDENVTYDASSSWDSESDIDLLTYRWTFGDEKVTDWLSAPVINYAFSEKGSYQVTFEIRDDDNYTDSMVKQINVKNGAPIADAGQDITIYEDTIITFNAFNSTDTSSDIASLNYTWEFDEGVTKYGVSVNHKYSISGDYIVGLKVTDDDLDSSYDSINITVVNFVPRAEIGFEGEVLVISKYEKLFLNGYSSTDTKSDLPLLTYIWDFGDNSKSTGIVINHTYNRTGLFNLTLKVIDDDGDWNISMIRIRVQELTLPKVTITLNIDPSTCSRGEYINISGQVDFEFDLPIESYRLDLNEFTIARLKIELEETGESWDLVTDINGQYTYQIQAPQFDGTHTVNVKVYYKLDTIAERSATFDVEKKSQGSDSAVISIDIILVTLTLGIFGTIGCFVAGTDIGRYSFFCLFIPLYTRIRRDEVLDNFTRGRIYEHIRKNPGEHYTALKRVLELKSGTLTHHLRILEHEEYIKSTRDGMYKRFYPIGMKVDHKKKSRTIQELILQEIAKNPRSTQQEIARNLGVDRSTVNYHINMMVGAGLIRSDKLGRSKRYYIQDSAVDEFITAD